MKKILLIFSAILFVNISAQKKGKDYSDILKSKNEGYNLEWEKEWSKFFSHQIDGYFSEYVLNYKTEIH